MTNIEGVIQSEDVSIEENLTNETINNIHTFLFDILAFFSNCQSSLIAEYCQEKENWNSIQRFFNDENTHILPIFFFDPQERSRLSKRSTIVLSNLNRSEKNDENCLEIGIDKSFEDGGVFFLKPNSIKLTEKNFKNELIIFSMNFDQQNLDLMVNLEIALLSYLPSIKKADEWNKLTFINENTDRLKYNLIYQIEQTADFFQTIHTSFIDCIQLQNVPIRLSHDTQEVINPNSLLRFAQDTELIQQAEQTIIEWIKDIQNFYRKSTLVRQIMSDSGPLNEIKYWRKQVIQLHCIMNQLRLPHNRAVIYLLNIAASPRLIEWKEIDKKLTQSINEARDHYKFLMIISKYIRPLYRNDPQEIQENFNNLLNTIVLINSCSEFYSKPEKITGLLISINNQIVISCKNYLTNNHTIDRKELLKRIENINNLYKIYREIFIKIKEKIENHYHDHLSECYLLGKFDFLNQHLNKFREIIESFEIYSLLSKSRIDGLEPIINIYNKIQNEFLTLKFDLNDQQFDLFYNQLSQILSDIDEKLYQIFNKDFYRILHSSSHNSFNAFKLLLRYENLHIPFFDSTEFLIDIIQWYEKEELEVIKQIYNQCRNIPNIERDHPPIIGRILWARRMYKRIQIPYVEFLKREELKNHSIMKKITNDFIIIANGFSIYELLYHRHWYNTLPNVINIMCNPLFIRQNVIRQLYINYNPFIDVILRECELLAQYSITMPDLGYKLLLDKNRIRLDYERLKKLLKDLSALLAKAHPASYELVEKVMAQVDNTLSIGLYRLNWLSKNLDELFIPAEEKIHLMSDFLDQISSLIKYRIEEPINEVSHFEILEFPDDSIDLKQFIYDIRQEIIFKAEKLNSLSMQIESAVLHVIKMFFDKLGYKSKPFEQKIGDIDLMQLSPMQKLAIQMFVQNPTKSKNPTQLPSNEWERLNDLCNDFLSSFETRLIEALTLCAKNTFEMIKNRANPTLIQMKSRLKKLRLYPLDTIDANADRQDHLKHPLILIHVELHSPAIILNPNIDEVQQLIHQLVNYVLNIFHGIRKWGEVRHVDSKLIHNYRMHDFSELLSMNENLRHIQQGEGFTLGAKTYYNTIANNKELIKLYQNIGNFFVENSTRFEKELEEYYKFRDLWEINKINQAKKFILSNPNYAAIQSIFYDFDETRDSIKRIDESKDIDPFRYLTTKFKLNLFDEIRQLELIFAKYIRIHYRTKFIGINDFFKKTEPRLNRQLRDLDDVRFVINTLDTLKENFVLIDQTIDPLEEVYNLFKRYSIDIPQEEQLSIEMLRNTHERLLKRARQVTHELVNTQQSFLDRFILDKSITASQMFGILDVATNDWTDGIFSTLWRRTLKAFEISTKSGIHEAWWIILDGPIDTIWIENLNSVLDDNKLLTLANGDRISMASNVKLIFEVHNIDNASPATVSRCGMIFMSSTVLSWRPIFQAWMTKQLKNIGFYIFELLEKHFDEIFKLLITKCSPKMKVYECNYIKQIIDLLDGLLNKEIEYTKIYLERLTIFSLMWSMGALLELNDRAKLQQYFIDCNNLDIPKNISQNDSIFDYLVNDNGQWEHWSTRVEPWEYPKDEKIEFASILVPNIDNVRITYLINILSKQEKSVLLIGESGTAKTVIITSYLKHYDSEQYLTRVINFSSITTNNFIQKTIENFVDKRVANTFGPSFGRKMTIFIDDINMPMINIWGDQEANEILRQLIEQKGFYSLTKPGDFLNIIDLQFLAAMCHPGGGRNDIPERLKRHFFILNCTLPSNNTIDHIFSSIGKYFCIERNFSNNIINLVEKSISATRILWQIVKEKFLPTPAKSHYIFNLRDLSRIWEGILQIDFNLNEYLQLWKHECTRVLADRLVLNIEKEWFRKEQYKIAKQIFGDIYQISIEEDSEVYFANFLRDELEVTDEMSDDIDLADLVPKIYEPISSWDVLQTKLINSMNKMNEEIRGNNMDLVFFKDAMIHLLRISRVINMPKGHLLLVGVGGSGKQSLTKLAAYIAGYKYFQISVSRTYTLNNFLDDLRNIYRRAGRLGQGIVFILTDNDIKDDQFLEYLNNILSSGEISGLITREEMDETLSELSVKMKKEYPKRALTNENLLNYYRERLRKNLHIVLCFSPDNRKFRERALKFPALISGCTIDWFYRWPLDALVAVSEVYLNRFDILVKSNTIKKNVIELMADIHDDVSRICENYYDKFRRRTYVTPKSFLSFINAFKLYYQKQREYFEKEKQKMKTGVEKLFEAAEQVQQITQELIAKEKHMAIANTEAAKQVSEMEVLRSAAEIKTKEVQESKETAEILVKQVNEEKSIAEEELSAAEVILKEAEEAVKVKQKNNLPFPTVVDSAQIKGNTITNLRKLAKPPEAIMIVLDMALILMKRRLDPIRIDPNLEEPFYASSKTEILRLLNFSGLLSTLLTIRELNDEIIELLAPYTEIKDLSEKARKAYKDLATLKTWTDKIQSYHAINKEVIPIKDKVQKAENSLRKASRKLARAERELERTEIGLAKCQHDFDSAMETKKTYQSDYDALLKRRNDANTLISGLTGEKIRWNEQNKAFEQSIEKLIGNAILITAFLSYCGPFNQEFRQRMLNEWQKQIQQRIIPFSENFNIIEQLNIEATVSSEWNLQGLPNDDLSIQNGIITTSNYRYPLLIDPQLQGKSWIKNMEHENDLLIITLNSKLFRQQLEDSISLGRPLLIEDVDEELDPILDNILEKNYLKLGLTQRVKIGDREVDVNQTFRLYITTKLANPNYSPEICARMSIIDFTVTQRGLEDQLLSLVIANERAELERERVTLARETTKNKRLLKELEENLLIKLTSIEGSVLDDPSLVEVLNANKRIAIEVKEKVAIAEDTKIKIITAREEYRSVAIRGSIIYFLISEISLVNHMYQISLQQFLGLFHESIIRSNKIAAIQKRIQNINDYLTYRTWFYTTRGLYEEDRLMFTLLMTLRIDLRRGKIRYDEFEILIKGGASLDLNTCPTKPFRWLNDLSWLNLLELSRIKEFHDVIDRLQKNEQIFKDWFEKESINLPETYENLNIFHRFLFIRCISPDQIIFQTRNYIQDSLGIKYLEISVLNLELIWKESDCKIPLLGLLSSGADPTSNIQVLAKKKNIDLFIVSMGQGQEILARRYLQQTSTIGGWLLLQNAHLGLNYLEEFHETLTAMDTFDPSFRVWLTTEIHPQFPIQILQSSIKFTNEPPQGVRAGLKRTYRLITQDKLEYIETMHWRLMLYATSFLHSIVQERRKFGPLGWNIPYEFNQTDWEASVQYIQNHLDDMNPKLGVSWKAVRYMISEIQYGGRITDDRDRQLMITYAKKWFSDLLFSLDFKFYDGYSIPKVKHLDEYFDYIDKLPLIDPPQIFGLHPNADITYSTNRAKSMLEKIVNIQPKEANSNLLNGETRDKIVHNITNDMLSKLPANFIEHEIREKLRNMGILNPMIIFLRQEIHRIDRVIRTVRNSLNDLQLAIDGIIILNDSLRQILDSIYDGRVPIDWIRYSWQSSTLGFWFSELLDRYTQYNNWLIYGRPKCFWMTGFFNPNGFLTAMRQEVTRMHKGWSLDTVTIDNLVLRSYKDDIRDPPIQGVYVYGLYLEGAGWNRKYSRLHESQNKIVYVQMPVIHIFAVNPTVTNQPNGIVVKDKKSRFSFRGKRNDQISIAPYVYMCPVYKKPMRTDLHFITMLKLASNDIPEHWILRGVALLCDIK